MKTTRIFTVLLLGLALLAACRPQEVKKPPDEVTVQLSWFHQAQFAGFYAAEGWTRCTRWSSCRESTEEGSKTSEVSETSEV